MVFLTDIPPLSSCAYINVLATVSAGALKNVLPKFKHNFMLFFPWNKAKTNFYDNIKQLGTQWKVKISIHTILLKKAH